MAKPIFISYARAASAEQAKALAEKLGDLAFFDTKVIDDGAHFPDELLDGVLGARVVVIFATKTYVERRFCRLEMKLALASGAAHVVVASGDGSNAVLDAMPAEIASQNWPKATETERLEALARERLEKAPTEIRAQLGTDEARAIAAVFREEAQIPEPRPLPVLCSVPAGIASQSLGNRFVGRAEDLRAIHFALLAGAGAAAQATCRIAAGGGFGKTRLAVEYCYRYGAAHYPGGLFWLNAAASDVKVELHRILRALAPATPDLAAMLEQKRDIRGELEQALRATAKPALYVVDDIPEAPAGQTPPAMSEYCPALGAVTVLATSRQKTVEAGVKIIALDTLSPEAAVLLLTQDLADLSALKWNEWGEIAKWVGYLPLALELLNRSLALESIPAGDLLKQTTAANTTGELDQLADALREQVPAGAVRGITEAFKMSYDKLDQAASGAALLLAQLAPAPIPLEFVDALPVELKTPAVRAALKSRNFVTGGAGLSFGAMHGLMADFLRSVDLEWQAQVLSGACQTLLNIMLAERCRDAREWPVMNLCRPHAEALFARGITRQDCALAACEVAMRAEVLADAQGDYASARRLAEKVVQIRTGVLGAEHDSTLDALNGLSIVVGKMGDHAAERKLQEDLLQTVKVKFGEKDARTLIVMNNLAETMREQGDSKNALPLHWQVWQTRKEILGEDNWDTLVSMNNVALALRKEGYFKQAVEMSEQVYERRKKLKGENHPATLNAKNNWGAALTSAGELAKARTLLAECLESRRKLLGENHPDTLSTLESLKVVDAAIAAAATAKS